MVFANTTSCLNSRCHAYPMSLAPEQLGNKHTVQLNETTWTASGSSMVHKTGTSPTCSYLAPINYRSRTTTLGASPSHLSPFATTCLLSRQIVNKRHLYSMLCLLAPYVRKQDNQPGKDETNRRRRPYVSEIEKGQKKTKMISSHIMVT